MDVFQNARSDEQESRRTSQLVIGLNLRPWVDLLDYHVEISSTSRNNVLERENTTYHVLERCDVGQLTTPLH